MEIEPRKFGDALNEWFRSLGRNWKPLLLSSLVVHVPLGIILAILFWLTGATDSFALYLDPEALESMTDTEILDAFAPFLWVAGIWMILQLLAGVWVYLAATRTVVGDMAGTGFSTREVSRFANGRTAAGVAAALLVFVGFAVVVALVIALGWVVISTGGASFLTVFVTTTAALTAIVVIVWLGVSFSIATQAIAVEDATPVAALRRSFNLIRGRWWITLGFLLVVSLIASAASQVISIVLVPVFAVGAVVPDMIAAAFGASTILQGPLLAALGAAYGIWYVDLRARDETLLAEQLV